MAIITGRAPNGKKKIQHGLRNVRRKVHRDARGHFVTIDGRRITITNPKDMSK